MKRILLIVCMASPLLTAQDVEVYFSQTAEEYFLLGMRQYSQKDFKPALTSFQRSIASMPNNHRITAALMMSAKSQFALRNYQDAIALCETMLERYPSTRYREDVYFTRGMCFYNLGNYQMTFDDMIRTYAIAEQRLNREHSYKVIDHIASEFLDVEEIDSLIVRTSDKDIDQLLLVTLAEKYFQNGSIEESKSTLERIEFADAELSIQFRMNKLLSRIEKGNLVRIGVLLPLQLSIQGDSREKKVVSEILEGIQLAVSDYEERSNEGEVSIELDVRDSKKDSAEIYSILTEWAEDSTIAGIIGPVFSAETIVAAALAQEYEIPIITPTATDEGISGIGPFVFQANSTNGAKGKTLAHYAVKELGAKTIAVLASAAQAPSIQADSFIVEAKRLGATIVTDRRFQRGESDLRLYVRAIRQEASLLRPDVIVPLRGKTNVGEITRKLASIGIRFSYIDSIIAVGGVFNFTLFFGDSAQRMADSLRMPVRRTTLYLDSLHYPVTTIDLVYCPISNSHEIGVLTSQLTFYNIKSMLLGSGDWYNPNELDLNKRYANGVIFGNDRWIDRNSGISRIFSRYSQKYGRQMSDNVMFGFDAMSMLIEQFAAGILSREQLAESLSSVVEFPGIRNAITLYPDRVNSALNILQFKNSAVTKLRTYSVQ